MNLLAVGLSHRTAPLAVLERAAVGADDLPKLLDELLGRENVAEALLLSTCNRVEVYAVVDSFHGGLADVSAVLARHGGWDVDDLAGHLVVHHAGSAVEHLFLVAAGMDSMVLGEAQILGQLRAAYARADDLGTVGRVLHELVQHALRVGKRAHAETGIDAAGASVVTEALAFGALELGGLRGRRALVVGAGSLAALTAADLARSGIAEIVVANRTVSTAQRLAGTVAAAGTPARGVGVDAVAAELPAADIVITCTGALDTVLTASMVAAVPRPLVICDLALPRDVEPAVRALPGVTLIDLDDLADRLRPAAAGTSAEAARTLVAVEVRRYLAAQRSAAVTPTVTALRRHASEVVDAELLRLGGRLPGLPAEVRAELSRTVHRVVDTLLHTPTVRVKQLAEGPSGSSYAEALRELFALDPQPGAVLDAASSRRRSTVNHPGASNAVPRPGDDVIGLSA
jgi:glutamyl-tRNA reductase